MKLTRVFLDTEFTQLFSPVHETKLISIGLVTEDGARTFYAELLEHYTTNECSDFVMEAVLPLLDAKPLTGEPDYSAFHAQLTEAEAATHLKAWVEALDGDIEMLSDAPAFDWPLVQDLLREGWPGNLLPKCRFPGPDPDSSTYSRALYNAYQRGLRKHHALDDALAMREAVLAYETTETS